MKLFNVDFHIAVVSDITNILSQLGHEVVSHNLSGHCSCVGLKQASIPMLDNDGWCGFWNRHGADKFYDLYKDEVNKCDAILVTYPPILAMLYNRFDKPIIIDIPIRYDHGVDGDADGWGMFNEYLRNGVDNGRIYLVANSRYDKEYTELFLGRRVTYIPSLCEYTGARYNPTDNRILCHGSVEVIHPRIIRKIKALQPGHSWQELMSFSGAVHIPYNVSVMTFFEQYSAGMPLFVPSIDFLMDLYKQSRGVLSQYSWARTYNRPNGSVIPCDGPDPNAHEDIDAVQHWMQYADFYNEEWFPEVLKFGSADELCGMMEMSKGELLNVSHRMRVHEETRRISIVEMWNDLMEGM